MNVLPHADGNIIRVVKTVVMFPVGGITQIKLVIKR
jgi:hypothetical protein